jgi:putative two-component system response regulator
VISTAQLVESLSEAQLASDANRFAGIIRELCARWGIPSEGSPACVTRTDGERALIERTAAIILADEVIGPPSLCAEILITNMAQSFSLMKEYDFLKVMRRAHRLACLGDSRTTLRRALGNLCLALIRSRDLTRAVEVGVHARKLAQQLGDKTGERAAVANIHAAMTELELHLEGTHLFENHPFLTSLDVAFAGEIVPIFLTNFAQNFHCLGNNLQAIKLARRALAIQPNATSDFFAWLSVTARNVLLRSLVAVGDTNEANVELRTIATLARRFPEGRIRTVHEHSIAAIEIARKQQDAAIARLNALRPRTESAPTLHRDTLHLLQQAYTAKGDHASAIACLAEEASERTRDQLERIACAFESLNEEFELESLSGEKTFDMAHQVKALAPIARSTCSGGADRQAMQQSFERLAVVAELNEDDSGRHAYRVGRLCALLAEETGQSHAACVDLEWAARLHDIGKLGLPPMLLLKAVPLSDDARTLMQSHCDIGHKLLSQAQHADFELAISVARHHHERWDGKGYPDKLQGDSIPLAARICAICEAFDAMTHHRSYRPALGVHEALSQLLAGSATQFDPDLLPRFAAMIIRLLAQHGDDLDGFLGAAADDSTFLQARSSLNVVLNELAPVEPIAPVETAAS